MRLSLTHTRLSFQLVELELAIEGSSNDKSKAKKAASAAESAEEGEDDERFLRDLDDADAWLRRLNTQSEALRTR